LPAHYNRRPAEHGVAKVLLTASGGPFLHRDLASLDSVTPEQAVAHPKWVMGRKISVDSATMMNKGLELIEAYHLFPVKAEQIDIVVHPESIIHSMVAYCDGSVLAQLNAPDMCVPIAFALAWPKRLQLHKSPLDLAQIGKLTFEHPDTERFPALRLARAALTEGKSAPTILNAANEVAVECFIQGKIAFLDIARIVEKTLSSMPARALGCLEDVAETDRDARLLARKLIAKQPVSAVSHYSHSK
jgi:1-deoxy-D-xylulose-5-phosphate reductoisomerase